MWPASSISKLLCRRLSTVAALRFPAPSGAANRAAASKQPRFFRRWRRFGCFQRRLPGILGGQGAARRGLFAGLLKRGLRPPFRFPRTSLRTGARPRRAGQGIFATYRRSIAPQRQDCARRRVSEPTARRAALRRRRSRPGTRRGENGLECCGRMGPGYTGPARWNARRIRPKGASFDLTNGLEFCIKRRAFRGKCPGNGQNLRIRSRRTRLRIDEDIKEKRSP